MSHLPPFFTTSARNILGVANRVLHNLERCEGGDALAVDTCQFAVAMLMSELQCTASELQAVMSAQLTLKPHMETALQVMVAAENGVQLN